jgi:PKD repeat protein
VLEVANGVVESLRSTPYASVGASAADVAAFYDAGGKYNGHDAVVVTSGAPPAREILTTPPAAGVPVPLTIRRWVTWTDSSGGLGHDLKRLDVKVTWTENGVAERSISLTSLLYPGGLGGSSSSSTGNHVPVASFSYSPSAPSQGTVVTFTSTSTDADGDTLALTWTFPDGSTSTAANPTYTFASAGSYNVILVVNDGHGGTSTTTGTVAVTAVNAAPVASFSVSTPSGRDDIVNVDGSGSSDPNGDQLAYAWTFGDGGTATGQTAQHRYYAPGTYTINLTVTDPGGLTSSTSRTQVVTNVRCSVISGSFHNPPGNSTANVIQVDSANRPVNSVFRFDAVTTPACGTVSARLPEAQGQPLSTSLTLLSTGVTKTWQATITVGNGDKFNLGNAQTGFVDASGGGFSDSLTFSFSVTP